MMKFEDYAKNNNLIICKEEYFKNLTTIGCGGLIKISYYPRSIKELQMVFKFICDNNIEYFILGNGSNVLARDDEYNGVVIMMKSLPSIITHKANLVIVSASLNSNYLANYLSDASLGDLSFLAGIPGLIGGAIYNNSGSFGDSIGNHIKYVKYIDSNGNIKTIDNELCAFSYRKSIFHYITGIIIEAHILVEKKETKERIKEYQKKRALNQPLNKKSMGSVFKNNPLIPSWRIIDALGLRGFAVGGAVVSDKHANFIINSDNAKSNDILSIIELIETRSKLELGIQMVKEITLV